MQTDVSTLADCIPLAIALEFWGLADMQFTITINQAKALEWELNAQQALLFAFVYECPSWAKLTQTADGVDFYALSKGKILEELPLLTDKPDTVYRLLKQLAAAGVIRMLRTGSSDIVGVALTDKGRDWSPAFATYSAATPAVSQYPRRRSTKKPIPQSLRVQVFERDDFACLRCGCNALHRLRADHVVAESLGGAATLENLQTLCMSCNSWKGVKTIDFRTSGGQA